MRIACLSARAHAERLDYQFVGGAYQLLTGVDVHLDDAVLDSGLDLVLGRTGSTVEDQEPANM